MLWPHGINTSRFSDQCGHTLIPSFSLGTKLISGIARIFRWGGKILKKGTCINSKQVILTCRECSGAYSHHYVLEGGLGVLPQKIFS